jgi:alpha-ketoglutarate-dependent taurine dioxygenase
MRLIRITDLANAGEAKSEGIRKLRSYAEEKINPGMLKKKLEVVEFNPASHTTSLNLNFRFTTHNAKK